MARRLRHVAGNAAQRLWKDLVYVALACGLAALHAARSRVPRRLHHHGGSPQEIVIYEVAISRESVVMPPPLRRYVHAFRGVHRRRRGSIRGVSCRRARACSTPARAKAITSAYFAAQRYCGLDLGVGDAAWDYSRLDVVGDLAALPFRRPALSTPRSTSSRWNTSASPRRVLAEIARTLAAGGRFLLIAPHRMGGASAAPRLFPLHALRARISAAAGRFRRTSTFVPWADFSACCRGGCSMPCSSFPGR